MEVLARYLGTTGPVCQIVPVSRGGFSGARIWQIRSDAGQWALRRWPPGPVDRARLNQLHALLESIQPRCAVPIAVPIANATGQTLTLEDGAWYQLEPWLSGQPATPGSVTEQQLEAAMHALADWHRAAREAVVVGTTAPETELLTPAGSGLPFPSARNRHRPPPAARWFTVTDAPSHAIGERYELLREAQPAELRRSVQQLKSSAGPEPARQLLELLDEHCALLNESLPAVRGELAAWQHECLPLQPCLRDIWSDHVLLTGDRVTGLIDPSAARTDTVAADLARLIGSYAGSQPDTWQKAVDAYGAVHRLTAAERRLIATLDRAAILLSPLTWLDRWRNRGLKPAQLPDVVVRVTGLVDRHRRLLSEPLR